MAIKTLLMYTNEDESLLIQLKESLAPLQWKDLITIYDCEVSAESRTSKLLEIASIILLLITPQFLDSDYCYSPQMKEMVERHKRGKILVLPVILRPAYWERTLFSPLQAVPKSGEAITLWEDEVAAFKEVVASVEEATIEMSRDTSTTVSSQGSLHTYLDIIRQGVSYWNQWREDHYEVQPDLHGADLSSTDLNRANFHGVDLRGADLHGANLSRADFSFAKLEKAHLRDARLNNSDLSFADFRETDLSFATLSDANLRGANFHSANLNGAQLRGARLDDAVLDYAVLDDTNLTAADLARANLVGASLRGANLTRTNFSSANLTDTVLNEALASATIFGNLDLRGIKGIEDIKHTKPSFIDIHTLLKSEGHISVAFLRGAGIPENFIVYIRSLMITPIQYHSCFIAYSSQDENLAQRLHADLQAVGIRCWFAPEDLKVGDRLRLRIDEAIHIADKLLLILSEHSLQSDWVEIEVEAALEKEQRQQREMLFPVRIDEALFQSQAAWAAHLRKQRHIGDFTGWKNHDTYQQAFQRLVRDLKRE